MKNVYIIDNNLGLNSLRKLPTLGLVPIPPRTFFVSEKILNLKSTVKSASDFFLFQKKPQTLNTVLN